MYEFKIEDIENIQGKFNAIIGKNVDLESEVEEMDAVACDTYMAFFRRLLSEDIGLHRLKAQFKHYVKNSRYLKAAHHLASLGKLSSAEFNVLKDKLRIKRGKSHSGVLVVTIFTSPYPSYTDEHGEKQTQSFSCKWNCYYCPNEPGQPRSYLKGEPGVMRANQHNFDCCDQMWGRMNTLYNIGHPIDKLEVIVLGGTWTSYPIPYQAEFIRDMYYAANTFFDTPEHRRPKRPLADELLMNQTNDCKVIGLTLETRPDTICVDEIIRFRGYGCTRVQIGIQHLHDDVLKKINRKCKYADVERAIRLLKDWGFKVDGHFMPNLPGSSFVKDTDMMRQLLGCAGVKKVEPRIPGIHVWEQWPVANEAVQIDQWKVYPCEVVPWTVIEKWYKDGTYVPYDEKDLSQLILDTKRNMFPWIRLNRIIRDIPMDYIMASSDTPNLRQDIQTIMKAKGYTCRCIRCREVKLQTYAGEISWGVREYASSNGTELFLSAESSDNSILFGFLRLRIPTDDHPTFRNHAWIRELHVYGLIQCTGTGVTAKQEHAHVQHTGIGKALLRYAETISVNVYHKSELVVISGEGTKAYYGKFGYNDTHYGYMSKNISPITSHEIQCASEDDHY